MSEEVKKEENKKKSHADDLAAMLGFDPSKSTSLTGDLFKEVVKEIQDEKLKEAKVKAKEHLLKAMTLRQQMVKVRKDFDKQWNQHEKELGNIMKQIHGIMSGKPAEEATEECAEKKECAEGS